MSENLRPALFHVSEAAGIERFEPRATPGSSGRAGEKLVWAVDEEHLHTYLLPRECPRVTFYARPDSQPQDIERLLGASTFVVAIESAWFERALTTPLYRYALPPDTFVVADAGAGYYVSTAAVEPLSVTRVERPLHTMLEPSAKPHGSDLHGSNLHGSNLHDVRPFGVEPQGIELRVLPSLWTLRDAVVASSLHFSNIRMRNAQPRP